MNPWKSSIIVISLTGLAFAILLLWREKMDLSSAPMKAGPETSLPRSADRKHGSHPEESGKKRTEREELALAERDKLLAAWSKNASSSFGQTRQQLVEDLSLNAGQSAELEKIFARREKELADLLSREPPQEAGKGGEILGKICALLRNKGLRGDLASVLSAPQLATFDATEANRARETVEAKAYRDMAGINAVVLLTDSQKQQALAALIKNASAKVEQEADARAFMTLHYGQMLTDVDSSSIRGLSNMVSAGLKNDTPDADIDSPQYQEWTQSNKTKRIESELSSLQDILDEKQFARYREHLEAEPAW